MPDPLHPGSQLASHSIGDILHVLQENGLILQFPPHIARLATQVPHRPKHAIELLILGGQQFTLSLLLQRSIIIAARIDVLIKLGGIG